MAPKATIGRIVHFTVDTERAMKLNQLGKKRFNTGEKVAGIVTRTGENGECSLTLFPEGVEELFCVGGIPFSAGNQPGTWNWPERVEQADTKEAAA
jgi:hypothetical protein